VTSIHRYSAYGLTIDSVVELPELPPGDGDVDVVVRVGRVDGVPAEARGGERYARAAGAVAHLYLRDGGACCVRAGREIVVDATVGGDERVLRLLVLGPALATLLRQRGRLVLHASAVEIGGAAIAFLGEEGRGKSTVAAAFHAAGHGVVDDDILTITTDGTVPLTIPGVPRVKMYPDVATHLGLDVEALAPLHPRDAKRGRTVADRFATGPLPLRVLYVLDDAETLSLAPLTPSAALVELLRHSYGARTLQATRTAEHFRQCATVAGRVPARVLRRPRSLAALPRLVEAVEQDLAAAAVAGHP
jgi:hypothetical protein